MRYIFEVPFTNITIYAIEEYSEIQKKKIILLKLNYKIIIVNS